MEVQEQNKAVIRRFLDYYNAQEINNLVSLLHPDIKYTTYKNGNIISDIEGRSTFRFIAERFKAHVSSHHLLLLGTLHASENSVNARFLFEAESANASTNAATGPTQKLSYELRTTFEFKDGIIHRWIDHIQ